MQTVVCYNVRMSATREKIYQYMYQRLSAGDPPTVREVQKAMGFKAVESARSHLEGLVRDGRLVKRESHSRSYALPPELRPSIQRIPILGRIQAGSLTHAEEEAEGFLGVDRDRCGEELFALRVHGESMVGVGILPNDVVVARRQETADSGDIVVALVGEEATLKRLLVEKAEGKQRVLLVAENPDFAPIEVTQEDLRLLGRVVEVRRFL